MTIIKIPLFVKTLKERVVNIYGGGGEQKKFETRFKQICDNWQFTSVNAVILQHFYSGTMVG
jgi:hypothetical protein